MLDVEAGPLLRSRRVVLPLVGLERPTVDAQQLADKSANWQFAAGSSGGAGPEIGKVAINDGSIHVRSAPLEGDFKVQVATKAGGRGRQGPDRGEREGPVRQAADHG